MKSVRLQAVGQPLVDATVADPSPAAGHVVVEVVSAGICHSDACYRSGRSAVAHHPITPGHEVAGVVAATGSGTAIKPGQRVCLHYLVSCGACPRCLRYGEQFCASGAMFGKDLDGGYAEYVLVPERNVIVLPDAVSYDHAAVMMCSSATALHALRRARLRAGETVAVFGLGGLGVSAVRLARLLGASAVFGVDPVEEKRAAARAESDGVFDPGAFSGGGLSDAIAAQNRGRLADVSVELVGSGVAVQDAVSVLAPGGRAAVVGLTAGSVPIPVYETLIGREAEVIGVSDHLISDVRDLLSWAASGRFTVEGAVTGQVPLSAAAVNQVLDELDAGTASIRTVIHPGRQAGFA